MIIAYTKDVKDYAKKLRTFDFQIVEYSNARYYDALIYKHSTSKNILSNLHPDAPTLFLDITHIAPKQAAHILKSGLYSPLF
jgi:hypothetical protein